MPGSGKRRSHGNKRNKPGFVPCLKTLAGFDAVLLDPSRLDAELRLVFVLVRFLLLFLSRINGLSVGETLEQAKRVNGILPLYPILEDTEKGQNGKEGAEHPRRHRVTRRKMRG